MSPTDLRVEEVYITQLGRRCMLMPSGRDGLHWGGAFKFRYLPAKPEDRIPVTQAYFWLSAQNVVYLRPEGRR